MIDRLLLTFFLDSHLHQHTMLCDFNLFVFFLQNHILIYCSSLFEAEKLGDIKLLKVM